MRAFLLGSLGLLLSCASSASGERVTTDSDTLGTLRRLGAITPAPRGARPLAAVLPPHAAAPLRLGEGDAWIEVTPLGLREEARGVEREGATIYGAAAPDLDLVYVRDEGRVEELRLARTPAAAALSSWSVRRGPSIATIQIVDGRIEAVDNKGIVRVQSEPAFAVDAAGARRPLQLALRGSTVDARLDVAGLETPIAIDPAWTAAAKPSGLARTLATLTLLPSGKALLAGGSELTTSTRLSTAEVYDPASNSWTSTANSMSTGREEHTATWFGGTSKRVIIIGGSGPGTMGGTSTTAEVYDETTNSFAAPMTLPVSMVPPPPPGGPLIPTSERRGHASVRLTTGEVLVIGGRSNSAVLDTMFIAREGQPLGSVLSTKLPTTVKDTNAVLLPDGRVLIASGASTSGSGADRYVKESYIITVSGSTATVTMRANLPVPRLRAIGFVADAGPYKGQAMFVGGSITAAASENLLVPSQGGIIYDATADKWLPLPTMASKRFLGAGALLAGGKFLITGGVSDVVISGNANDDAEVLDLNAMAWKPAGRMAEPRAAHSAVALNDGSMLLVGGVKSSIDGFLTLTSTAERFKQQAAGAACAYDGECTSGFCADGVCCDKACTGQCEACDVAGSIGTCKPVSGPPHGKREKCALELTTDPGCGLSCDGTDATACKYPGATATCSADACTAGRETHASTCDGAGKCKDVAKACGDYTCDGKTCKTSCATKADCTNAAHFCEAGKCIPQQANGSACTRDDACASGLCVDGTCCESKCDGQCQACDVPGQAGKCVAIKGKPHGARPDCEKDATDACKSKACDGTNTAACGGTVGPCVNFACDDREKVCRTSCIADIDCGSGFQCDPASGNCVPRTSRCIGNAELQAADGSKTKCSAFICRDGACLDRCTSTNDCQNGFLCGGDGACVSTSGASSGEDSGGCSMGARPSSGGWLAALLALAALARRRSSSV